MPTARKYQISLTDTPYYHCISRCVRRAFLCGKDIITGKSYEHRKQWVADKLSELENSFAIDVFAYAIMSNHTHTVLRINHSQSDNWTREEVIKRWTQLFSGGVLIQRYQTGECKTQAEVDKVYEVIEIWRERLTDISWFMRCLNESIARKANAEDKCTGRFWEGRFKSQALLDEQALLACMVYVDLNPIRAGIHSTLEESKYTSIAQRIDEFSKMAVNNQTEQEQQSPSISLADFIGSSQSKQGIPYTLHDYFELADWSGRAIRDDKKGYIPKAEPKILQKLGIDSSIWLETVDSFSHHFYGFVGPEDKLETICRQQHKKWLTGIQICRKLFGNNNQLCI
jgi:REP-associated tyrosine transposase